MTNVIDRTADNLYVGAIRAEHGYALIELDEEDAGDPERRFYVVRVGRDSGGVGQVYSCLPSDMPGQSNGCWCARASAAGVRYVAHGRTRRAAMEQWRRYIAPAIAEALQREREYAEALQWEEENNGHPHY